MSKLDALAPPLDWARFGNATCAAKPGATSNICCQHVIPAEVASDEIAAHCLDLLQLLVNCRLVRHQQRLECIHQAVNGQKQGEWQGVFGRCCSMQAWMGSAAGMAARKGVV